jgi:serine/threonine protein kinase
MSDVLPAGAELVPGYEVLDHLKRTLVLDVYDVWSEERRARCVAKTLRPDRLDDTRARRALAREAQVLMSLTHPHIVRCYEHIARPRPVVLLETLTGATLARLLDDRPRRRLAGADLGWLGIHLCSALSYLHRQPLLHLDLKPSNIISDNGQAKLIDLSIARAPGRLQPGIGTREYMAPEQHEGGRVDTWTDVYGLGAVLFEAATGERAAAGSSVRGARRLPRPVADAIDGALQPDPRSRPSVDEVEAALDTLVAYAQRAHFRDELRGLVARDVRRVGRRRWSRRWRLLAATQAFDDPGVAVDRADDDLLVGDRRPREDDCVAQRGAVADRRAVADHDGAHQADAGSDRHVLADPDLAVDEGVVRHGRARRHLDPQRAAQGVERAGAQLVE